MEKAIIGMDKSGSYRVYLAVTTQMAEEARRIHNTSPTATAALGRLLTGAGLMGLMLKNPKDKLTVQIKGDGPAGEILATAKGNGRVKGYISNPDVDLPLRADGKLDVGGSVGIGTLTVIKDQGLKEPYMGKIDLVSGEIAEDLTTYFFLSEQQSTSVALGVKIGIDGSVAASGGMIIQMLPNPDPNAIDALEAMLDKLPSLSSLVEEVGNKDGQKACLSLLNRIFGSIPDKYQVNVMEYKDIMWDCDCSEPRLEQILLTLGEHELRKIIDEDGEAELTCQFCTKKYHFDRQHLEMLLRVAVKSKQILDERRKRMEEQQC